MFFEDNLVKYNNFSLILSIHFVKYKRITVHCSFDHFFEYNSCQICTTFIIILV